MVKPCAKSATKGGLPFQASRMHRPLDLEYGYDCRADCCAASCRMRNFDHTWTNTEAARLIQPASVNRDGPPTEADDFGAE